MTRGIYQPPEYRPGARERAISQIKSLYAGEAAVLEAVACGQAIVPELRQLLFRREPSGLFEVRIRTVHALTKLGARGVLLDFLLTRKPFTDAVEQLGEDAVISGAARALADWHEVDLFAALMKLAKRPCLTGVIFALGATRRKEAIPVLVRALGEDASRLTAERALIAYGEKAQPTLIDVATNCSQGLAQSESQLRQRRSAVCLLAQMGVSPPMWRKMRGLVDDSDSRISITACSMALRQGSNRDKRRAIRQLLQLLPSADWPEREDAERCLIENATTVRAAMRQSARLEGFGELDNASLALVARIIG